MYWILCQIYRNVRIISKMPLQLCKVCHVSPQASTLKMTRFVRETGDILRFPFQCLVETDVRSQNSAETLPSACIFSSLCCVTEAFLNVGDPGEIKSIVKSHAHVVKYQGFDLASHQPKRDSTVNHLSCLPHLWMACLQTESNKSWVLCCQSGIYMLQVMISMSFTCINPVCGGRPAWSPGWRIQTPGGAQSPAPPWRRRTADSRWLSKHEWSTCPVGISRIVVLALTSWGTCLSVRFNRHRPYVWRYLSMRAFLQRGLYHNVALHAHLELRDLGWHTAIAGRPQCSQKLASSDSVHYHGPVLTQSGWQVRVSKDARTQMLLWCCHVDRSLHFEHCTFFYKPKTRGLTCSLFIGIFGNLSCCYFWQQRDETAQCRAPKAKAERDICIMYFPITFTLERNSSNQTKLCFIFVTLSFPCINNRWL